MVIPPTNEPVKNLTRVKIQTTDRDAREKMSKCTVYYLPVGGGLRLDGLDLVFDHIAELFRRPPAGVGGAKPVHRQRNMAVEAAQISLIQATAVPALVIKYNIDKQ